MKADESISESLPRWSPAAPPVDMVVNPRYRDLVGFQINRVWPTAQRRLVGPFIFFDHMLPVDLPPGCGLDVPPHPHIGLATVTYLFAGELMHRDSLGSEQAIRPGELNWMTAGRGIVHSERSTGSARRGQSQLHGIQAWVALPRSHETVAPSFRHYSADQIPKIERAGVELKIIAGNAFGQHSPAETMSELFYVEADLAAGSRLDFDSGLGERAAYIVQGSVGVAQTVYDAGQMLVLRPGLDVSLVASVDAKLMLFGGSPLPGDWHIWWNFVASSAERIEQARSDWEGRRFPHVPGDAGHMPAPGR